MHQIECPDVVVSPSSVLRAMDRRGLLQPVNYQAERRELARARRDAFIVPPTFRNAVWQLDFSEFETLAGGTWRIAGCADYYAKHEFGWWISPTQNTHDGVVDDDDKQAHAEHAQREPTPMRDVCDDRAFAHDLLESKSPTCVA
jgi:putative transposase